MQWISLPQERIHFCATVIKISNFWFLEKRGNFLISWTIPGLKIELLRSEHIFRIFRIVSALLNVRILFTQFCLSAISFIDGYLKAFLIS